nr:hypothetical protein BaRGS_007936 [Batillaria attramentaria]
MLTDPTGKRLEVSEQPQNNYTHNMQNSSGVPPRPWMEPTADSEAGTIFIMHGDGDEEDDRNYRAFNGLCGSKFLKMIPGVCDETIDAAGHKCPLGGINPARCYGTSCECAYQRFRVVERCATDSFQVSNCTALKCPAPARCNEDRKNCRCPPGYFAWGKVCVTYFFQPHGACNTASCPSTSGACNGNRCVCDARHIADGHVCRMLSFPLMPGDQTNPTSCGINGMVGGSRCYCNPGYVVTRDASGTKLSCTRSYLMQQRWGDRSGTHHHIVV